MPQVLEASKARVQIESLNLQPPIITLISQLVDHLDNNGHAVIEEVNQSLFPLAKPDSANAQLNRLLNAFNTHAQAHGATIRMNRTAAKKVVAESGRVWFEGEHSLPETVRTPELDRIKPESLLDLQGDLFTPDPLATGSTEDDGRPRALIVTFNENETRGVYEVFGEPQRNVQGVLVPVADLGNHGSWRVFHLTSRQGTVKAQVTIDQGIEEVKPELVLACGIAFGSNSKKQKIGDVLCATSLIDYELATQRQGEITRRGESPPASSKVQTRFEAVRNMFLQNIPPFGEPLTIHLGKVLSGNKLIDDINYRKQLLNYYDNDVIGGEMEGIGLHSAAQEKHHIEWALIKGICDWADGNKNNRSKVRHQIIAGRNAARVTKLFLDTYPTPPIIVRKSSVPRPHTKDLDLLPLDITDQIGDEFSMIKGLMLETQEVDRAKDVRQHLRLWANAERTTPCFALLGEYGMGKTIAAQRLARDLLEDYELDNSKRIPLLFDFRNLSVNSGHVPNLDEVLMEGSRVSWTHDAIGERFTLARIYELLRRGSVVIFDGLDELLVKLTEDEGQQLTRHLLGIFQNHYQTWSEHRKLKPQEADPKSIPRVLITCRTQYFKDIRAQRTHFTGQERAQNEEDFTAVILRPLNEDQAMAYLQQCVQGQTAERLKELLHSVQRLSDLTERPYTLKLVSEFLPQIEQWQLQGKTVYAITLYREMVQRWLERDKGKHLIKQEDKLTMARRLAHHLWTEGQGVLPIENLERWFFDWLDSENHLKRRYGKLNSDQLEEDLRNSTFLARQDKDGETMGFRFSHTSLLEFFLANDLLESIRNDVPQRWDIRTPSRETLSFLGQFIISDKQKDELLKTLEKWRFDLPKQARQLYLDYSRLARQQGWPAPALHGGQFSEVTLKGDVFPLLEGESELDLRNVNFADAMLEGSEWQAVNLSGANFKGARLSQTMWQNCTLKQANFCEADLTGCIWRSCNLQAAQLTGAVLHDAQVMWSVGNLPTELQDIETTSLNIDLSGANPVWIDYPLNIKHMTLFHDTLLAAVSSPIKTVIFDIKSGRIKRQFFHPYEASFLDWSPDKSRLAQSGPSGLYLLHDEEIIWHLPEATGPLRWSRNGKRLAVGCSSCVLIVESYTGKLIQTIQHEAGTVVKALDWSENDMHLAIAGNTAYCVLNGISGRLVRRVENTSVSALAWMNHGQHLAISDMDGVYLLDQTWDNYIWHYKESDIENMQWSPDDLCLMCFSRHDVALIDRLGSLRNMPRFLSGFGPTQGIWLNNSEMLFTELFDIFITDLINGSIRRFISSSTRNFSLWASKESEVITFSNHTAYSLNLSTGQQTRAVELTWPTSIPKLSPDGRRLIYFGIDDIKLLDYQNFEILAEIKYTNTNKRYFNHSRIAWAHDSNRFIIAFPGSLEIHTIGSSEVIFVDSIDIRGEFITIIDCCPTSECIAIAFTERLIIYDVQQAQTLVSLSLPYNVMDMQWSPDSQRLAIAMTECLWVVDTEGETIWKAVKHVRKVKWSHAGAHLLFDGLHGMYIADGHTGDVIISIDTRANSELLPNEIQWSSNDQQLLISGFQSTYVVDVISGKIQQYLYMHYSGIASWEEGETNFKFLQGDVWRHMHWAKPNKDGTKTLFPIEVNGIHVPSND